ncbi:MAG: hypothetical protein IJ532_01350 [Alphaproteobacteria bacterium]|nr:hypothetical protein [Alphaproteobacteria bacterium]
MYNKYKEPETFWEKVEEFYKYNQKRLSRLFKFAAVCLVFIIGFKVVNVATYNYKLNKDVKAAVAEITAMIRNIRTLYATNGQEVSNISELLIQSGAVSKSSVGDVGIKNILGGKIVIVSKIRKNKKPSESEKSSFVLAYQGLPHGVCVKLAGLDWGNSKSGLMAEAIGVVDEEGNDSALTDIENYDGKEVAVVGKDGKVRYTEIKQRKMYTVAKPDDNLTQYPIPENAAILGCACGKLNVCSFVLRYSIFPER